MEEVVVTARKREERVLDTPIAITAISGAQMEIRGMENITSVGDIAPNVNFSFAGTSSGSGSAAVVFIRGVGQNDFIPVTDPGVGVYVDGVYLGRSVGSVLELMDFERVEVLRGPQGTLFGRNTIGGAINVISKSPGDETTGRLRAVVGDDSRFELGGTLSTPLGDNVGFLGTIMSKNRDGYVERPFGGKAMGDDDMLGARAKLVWDATDNVAVTFSADYVRERETSAPEVSTNYNATSLFGGFWNNNMFGNGSTSANCAVNPTDQSDPECANNQYSGAPYTSFETGPSINNIDNWGISLIVDWEISDAVTMRSITAHRDLDAQFARANDGMPFDIFNLEYDYTAEQFSQEFQFLGTSVNEQLDWVAGLYYFEEQANDASRLGALPPNFPRRAGGATDNDNWAIFGEGTYHATDSLHLTLGLRYTDETKRYTPDNFWIPQDIFVVPPVENKDSFDEVSWRATVGYDLNESSNVYFTASTGFKSGGFNSRIAGFTFVPAYDPETVTLLELGFKGAVQDGRFRYAVAIFDSDYEDMQVAANPPGSIATITSNAAEGSISGIEGEIEWMPVDALLINASVGFLDAKYDDTGTAVVSVADDFIRAPEFTGNLGISYQVEAAGGYITPRLDWTYTSETQFEPVNDPFVAQDGYNKADLNVSYQPQSEKWKVTAGVMNLTDEEYIIAGDSNSTIGYALAVYARPRNWFVAFNYEF